MRRRVGCSCGSGLAPGRCCGAGRRARELGLRVLEGGAPPRLAGGSPLTWSVVRPVPGRPALAAIELDLLDLGGEDELARAAVCVVAGVAVLHFAFLRRLPADGAQGILILEEAILRVADAGGAMPLEVRLRDAAQATLLAERFRRWRVRCRSDLPLYGVESLLADLARSRVRARSLGARAGGCP